MAATALFIDAIPQKRRPERFHRKKFPWYVAQTEGGAVVAARNMVRLLKHLNSSRAPAAQLSKTHMYRNCTGEQQSAHKGVTCRRFDTQEAFDAWSTAWKERGGSYVYFF